eukprot:CAMPEP_0185803588 /NCGR_PEP_ID=MMETSP1322-20130828/2739_1 /TAXON_ID=265543 /ORGANISM="Minutocellus polymorphus, Strain RCC2270" /LENGTH=581 /DNA_ID=CAMNT_0028499493 /DNA_START=33 /DNA_END=1778 /DNA_ORIENTATION=+
MALQIYTYAFASVAILFMALPPVRPASIDCSAYEYKGDWWPVDIRKDYVCRSAHCARYDSPLSEGTTPQLIVLTFDDAITEQSFTHMQPLLTLNNPNNCPIKSTHYVSLRNGDNPLLTVPSLAYNLYRAGHEIALHTFSHIGTPSEEEIVSVRTWLHEHAKIPEEAMVGFRAPYLDYDTETFKILNRTHFEYDSSVTTQAPIWPYSLASGFAFPCPNNQCNVNTELHNLFSLPMRTMRNSRGSLVSGMDPVAPEGAYELYRNHFEEVYCQERVPMGIFLHTAWLHDENNAKGLKKFLIEVLENDDVYAVTAHDLLRWVKNPVPASDAPNFFNCDDDHELTFPPEGGCYHGRFNAIIGRCECFVGYATETVTGPCTVPVALETLPPSDAPIFDKNNLMMANTCDQVDTEAKCHATGDRCGCEGVTCCEGVCAGTVWYAVCKSEDSISASELLIGDNPDYSKYDLEVDPGTVLGKLANTLPDIVIPSEETVVKIQDDLKLYNTLLEDYAMSQPSTVPSDQPSVSSQPSDTPSDQPSVSSQPSDAPSVFPSSLPSQTISGDLSKGSFAFRCKILLGVVATFFLY